MAVRGRKPKPSHLKLVTGNPGKRAINTQEPVPERILPAPPAELTAEARASGTGSPVSSTASAS